jgi:hypothetical protein
MKTANKIIMVVSAILAATIGVGATATYAWFRVSRNAVVNITNATLTGEGSSLKIAYYKLSDSGTLPDSATPTAKGFGVIAITNSITDISGDGVTFYKPGWALDASETEQKATGISTVVNSSTKTYYIRFGISFTNSGESGFDLYFQDDTAVTPVTIEVPENETEEAKTARLAQQAKNDRAAKTTRIALWNEGHSNLLSMWQPDSTDGTNFTDYTYIQKNAADTTGIYNVPGYSLVNPAESTFHIGTFTHLSSTPSTVSNGQHLIHVDANSTVKTEFALWAEGTFSLTTNEAQGGQINAALSFIAL